MSKILIILKGQHGYNTDYLEMANYLAEQGMQVDIICFDYNFIKVDTKNNINVTYIERKKSKMANLIHYNIKMFKRILKRRKEYNWIVVSGVIEYCGIIPFIFKKFTPRVSWIMDIRTCSVSENEKKRRSYDASMLWSTKFFDHVTIISDLLAERLKIKTYTLLPLGANCIVDIDRKRLDREKVNFIYVGTFENRNIDNVIKAYDIFCSKTKNNISSKFDLIGFSYTDETQKKVLESIENAKNKDAIIYHGRKNHDEIIDLFQEAHIGFSYVPVTDYYDVQPPTKTFEYIVNGIICIGTNTKANAQIINVRNGILTDDDVDSVVKGIETVVRNYKNYNCLELSKTMEEYTWNKIEENFYKFLKKIDLKKIK